MNIEIPLAVVGLSVSNKISDGVRPEIVVIKRIVASGYRKEQENRGSYLKT